MSTSCHECTIPNKFVMKQLELLDDLENILLDLHEQVFSDEKYQDLDRDGLCIALDDVERLRISIQSTELIKSNEEKN